MPFGKLKQEIHPSRQNLLRLCLIRSIVIVGLLAFSFWFQFYGTITFPSLPMFSILSVMVVVNVLILLRLRSDSPVSENEFFANLLLDVLFLTLVLYFTGGSTNPIVSYYLIPLIISAAILRPAHTWFIALLKIRYDQSLQHALMSLLNNAADASPEFVSMQIGSMPGRLQIVIEDHGAGIPAAIADSLGKTSVSRKQGGLGLGVLLGQASIERLGGEVILSGKQGSGTRLEIRLPLTGVAESG